MSEIDYAIHAPLSSTPRRQNIPALFLGMIIRPRVTLGHLRDAGGPSWMWPAVLAVVLFIASVLVQAPITRAAINERLERQEEVFGQGLTPQEQAQADRMRALMTGPLVTIVFPVVTGLIGLSLGWLFRAGALYLPSLAFGGQARFGDIFRMSLWTSLPDSARLLVTTLGTFFTGRLLTSGLAATVTPGASPDVPSILLRTFLSQLDVYLIWGLALTAIGIAVTARLSGRKSILVTAIYWLLVFLTGFVFAWVGAFFAEKVSF